MSDFLERLLCIDGKCTGTINERGYCNVCGKSLNRKHDPLRVEQEVDAKNHNVLTQFQLECERLLNERLAQVGSRISNRTEVFRESFVGRIKSSWNESFLKSLFPTSSTPLPEPGRTPTYITGTIEGTDIEFWIYPHGADFNSSHGSEEFWVPAGVSLAGLAEEFVGNVLTTLQKEKAEDREKEAG